MANLPDLFRSNRSLFSDFFRDLDDFFGSNAVSSGDIASRGANILQPQIDVREEQGNWVLSIEMPGVKKEDVNVDISENRLTISGERGQEFREGGASGRSFGRFVSSFTLPSGIGPEQVKAFYENGLLEVSVPKMEASNRRSIQIEEGRMTREQIPPKKGAKAEAQKVQH